MRSPDGVAERNNGETSLFFGIALSSEVTNLGEATDSKLILIFSMFVGRLELMVVYVLFTLTFWRG